jgi:hypothetical protein
MAIDTREKYAEGLATEEQATAAEARADGAAAEAAYGVAHPGDADFYAMAEAALAIVSAGNPVGMVAHAAQASGYAALARTPDETVVAITAVYKQQGWRGRPQWDTDEDTIRRSPTYITASSAERTAQAGLLRCIVGDPFRPVTVHPFWLAWGNGTVAKLAQAIYDQRAFDLLPILADALGEAGCHDAEILAHCRGPGPHTRGCWAVDSLLGKG